MRHLMIGGLFLLTGPSTAAESVNDPIQMFIGNNVTWSVGLQCEVHLTSPEIKRDEVLPCVRVPVGWFIEMNGDPQNIAPALIEVGDGKHCLVAYNDLCLIRGNRLDVR